MAQRVPRPATEMPGTERLRRLHDAIANVSRSLDLGDRTRAVVSAARDLESADAASVMLCDPGADVLRIEAHEGLSETYASRQRIPMERARAAYRGPDVHILLDLRQGPLGDADLIRAEGLAKALAVPLVHEGTLIGALTIYTKDPERSFSEDDVEIAHILAGQGAVGIASSRLYEEAVAQRRLNRELLDALGEGVVITWPDGRSELNPRAREILGIESPVTTLDQLRELLKVEVAGDPPADRALRGEASSGEYSLLDVRTGDRRDIYGTTAPVLGPDGTVLAAVTTIHDLASARAQEREREQFLSIVSHELRTPLTPLKALAQLIRSRMRRSRERGTPLDLESMERNLGAIERQVDRMTGLVNDLLSVSRAQHGTLRMEWSTFDLADLVREVVQRYIAATAEEGRHRFAIAAPERFPARGDQSRIDQLLMNLLGNAVKYSPTGGEIRVSVVEHDGTAEIAIQDEGIGIPADDLPRLGRPFARGTGRAATFAGMGIGLYVARLVAEGHAGALEIESEGDGRGTTVRVRLPL